jgi:signal transduction histidine kinase
MYYDVRHLAQLGRLSASLLHELRNPLTAMLINLELIDNPGPEIRQLKRDAELLCEYLEAANQQAPRRAYLSQFSVRTQFKQIKRIVQPLARQAGVDLKFTTVPIAYLYGDPLKFQQVVVNIIAVTIGAHEAAAASATAPVKVALAVEQGCLILVVTDRGVIDHNLGIGLSLVRQHVTLDLGGAIEISSAPAKGTRCLVKIPIVKWTQLK